MWEDCTGSGLNLNVRDVVARSLLPLGCHLFSSSSSSSSSSELTVGAHLDGLDGAQSLLMSLVGSHGNGIVRWVGGWVGGWVIGKEAV